MMIEFYSQLFEVTVVFFTSNFYFNLVGGHTDRQSISTSGTLRNSLKKLPSLSMAQAYRSLPSYFTKKFIRGFIKT